MGDSKYGRIFTEGDMIVFNSRIRERSEAEDRKLTDEEVREELASWKESHFPPDEPIFTIRAQDQAALKSIESYRHIAEEAGSPESHIATVESALDAFDDFRTDNPDRMKAAD